MVFVLLEPLTPLKLNRTLHENQINMQMSIRDIHNVYANTKLTMNINATVLRALKLT